MNHFLRITSSGGYIGRFAWTNTGVHPDLPHWGELYIMPTKGITNSAWAGSIWPIRCFTNL